MKANDQLGQFNGPGEVRFLRTLPGPIERIWDFLTDAEKRSRWFAGGPMEPREGGKFTLNFRHILIAPDETPPADHEEFHDPGCKMEGIVTRWEPPRVLAYTFGDTGESEVTFELTPQGASILLVLTHRARGDDLPYITGYAAGWHTHLAQLIALLEGASRPPFWPMHTRLGPEYKQLRASTRLS